MNGCVIDGTPIAVDCWDKKIARKARLFFLTHLHADHTKGLTSTWMHKIYTSPLNAILLRQKFNIKASRVQMLCIGESHVIPLDEKDETITVTPIDANHVPGAVMFLFQGYFGNILYCGDIRWTPEMLENPALRDVVDQHMLHILYLDNTYSAPYCNFPSREEVTQQIYDIIDQYPNHEIKIGINTLGKESLLEGIAQRYEERILVSQDKYDQLQLLGRLDVYTTDPFKSRIHAVPLKQVQLSSHRNWNNNHPTVSIIPSALFVGWNNGPYSSQAKNGLYVVPYSDHSSYPELMDMVTQLAPHRILPIVKFWSKSGWWSDPSAPDFTVKSDMNVYNHLLSPSPPQPFQIPESVANYMNCDESRLITQRSRRSLPQRTTAKHNKVRGVQFSTPSPLSLPSSPRCPSPEKSTESSRAQEDKETTLFHANQSLQTTDIEIAIDTGPNKIPSQISKQTPLSNQHKSSEVEQVYPSNYTTFNESYGSYQNKHISKKRAEQVDSPPKERHVLTTEEKRSLCQVSIERSKLQNLTYTDKYEKDLSLRRDCLIKETIDLLECTTEKINNQTYATTPTELLEDATLILEAVSCLDSLL